MPSILVSVWLVKAYGSLFFSIFVVILGRENRMLILLFPTYYFLVHSVKFRANIATNGIAKLTWSLTLIDSSSTYVQSFSKNYAVSDEDKVNEGYVKLSCFETSWL